MNKQKKYVYSVMMVLSSLVLPVQAMEVPEKVADQMEGVLIIENQFPSPFSIQWKYEGRVNGIDRLAPGQKVDLGKLLQISDLQIMPYGEYKGKSLSYLYSADYDQRKLNECQATPGMNCTLVIKAGWRGWKIDVKKTEAARIEPQRQVPENPIDYFGKLDEPRKILGLKPNYTEQDVAEAINRLRQNIVSSFADSPQAQGLLDFLTQIRQYALAFIGARATQELKNKLLLEWQSLLEPVRVARGRRISCLLLAGRRLSLADQDRYLDGIIDLMWYFYSLAVEKGQVFSEGTFVIEDPGYRFYNFLMQYVQLVNPAVKGTREDPQLKLSQNSYAYSRLSSHFPRERMTHRHYGIDIRFKGAGAAEGLLPTEKTHILFGKLDPRKNTMFIKLESVGIYGREVPLHALEFVVAQIRKPGLRKLYEAWLPTAAAENILYYIGKDEGPTFRKERIPGEFLDRCYEILSMGERLKNEQIESLIFDFTRSGVQFLDYIVKNPLAELSREQMEAFRAYYNELLQEYDNLELRYGREVILRHALFFQKCKELARRMRPE